MSLKVRGCGAIIPVVGRDFPHPPSPDRNKGFFLPKAALSIAAWVSEKDPVMVERKMLKVKHRLKVTCYTIGKVFL